MSKSHGRQAIVLPEPMIQVGRHEPLSFRRRTGQAWTNEAETWDYGHSEDLVRRLAERGVTWVRTHFFKGYGLKAEAEEIALTKQFVQCCHRHGIKVQLYTQFGTLQYETFLDEAPDMLDWACINEEGHLVRIRYGHQDFRLKPCLVRDGYWRYFRKVLRVAIEEVNGDGFGFDNVESPTEPDACHCPECRAAFVAYLKKKYRITTRAGRALAKERFGFPILDHIRPPTFNRFNPPVTYRQVRNPVFQEWAEFRCENLRRRFEEIWRTVKRLKPAMMIEYNVYPPFGKNAAYWQGIDMHRLGPFLDMFYNERDPSQPEFRPGGLFRHRVHGYKLGQAIGAVGVITGNGGSTRDRRNLSLAEVLAFNQGHLVRIGRPEQIASGDFPEADAFIRFRKGHADLFDGTEPAAEVGLFESAVSRAHNSVEPYVAELLAMNGLLAGHVPFDLVTSLDVRSISRYAVLILPDVECLSDDDARSLTAYVEGGGGLVVTGDTSLYDPWYRRRPALALQPLLKRAGSGRLVAAMDPDKVLRGTAGQGRFAYLWRLIPPQPFTSFEHCTDGPNLHPDLWRLPTNVAALLKGVAWTGKELSLAVTAPMGLAAEARRAPDSRLVLHLVNYDLNRPAQRVSVRLWRQVEGARLWTPWTAKPRRLRAERARGATRVPLGTIRRYAIVEIE